VDSKIVYEDDSIMAFLDINPVSEGHTLIIPKKHYENIFDIENLALDKIVRAAKRLASAYKDAFNVNAVNLLNASGAAAQQSVSHFHLHLVPRQENDGLDFWFHGKGESKEALAKTLEKIRKFVKY
jgi:Diadenosine tetraphosphate (Ap4A) hydrolase and other HIT family hydrolases